MTESAEVLIHLITVLTTFAKHFGQYVISGESFRNCPSWDLTRSPAARRVRATQPFLQTRFTLIVSRFLPTSFGTLVTIQEHSRFVSLLTFTLLHNTMHVLAEGDVSDIAK
jgi:hypothetical protein